MTGAGLGGLYGRGWSLLSFLEAGVWQGLPHVDARTPALLPSSPWSLASGSFSLATQLLRVAGSSGPGPSLCSRLHGETAKPCVRLSSQPAKKLVLGLGEMRPSSRPPGAAAAGAWAGRAGAGGPCSWMERKEVFMCCSGPGCSAISSTGGRAGPCQGPVANLRAIGGWVVAAAAVGRGDSAPWYQRSLRKQKTDLQQLEGIWRQSWLGNWSLPSFPRTTQTGWWGLLGREPGTWYAAGGLPASYLKWKGPWATCSVLLSILVVLISQTEPARCWVASMQGFQSHWQVY